MQTTKLYVELIIIGLESFAGLLLTISSIVGIERAGKIISYFENASALLVLLGILYILGLVFDRLADLIFQPLENALRDKSGLKAKSVMLIPLNSGQHDFMTYLCSRKRILRATILNSLFIMIAAICFVSLHITDNKLGLFLFIIIFCVFTACVSFVSFNKLVKNIYNKARIIEMDLECQLHNMKQESTVK